MNDSEWLMRGFGSNGVMKGMSNATLLSYSSTYHRKLRKFQGLTMTGFAGHRIASRSSASGCINAKWPRVLMLPWRYPSGLPARGPLLDSPAANWPSPVAAHLNPSPLGHTFPGSSQPVADHRGSVILWPVCSSAWDLPRTAVKVRTPPSQSFFPVHSLLLHHFLFRNTSLQSLLSLDTLECMCLSPIN